MTASTWSGVMFLKAASRRIPALLTRMSTWPKASMAVVTIAAPPSGVATESPLATAVPPSAVISSTTACAADVGPAGPVDCAAQVVDDDAGAAAGQF